MMVKKMAHFSLPQQKLTDIMEVDRKEKKQKIIMTGVHVSCKHSKLFKHTLQGIFFLE